MNKIALFAAGGIALFLTAGAFGLMALMMFQDARDPISAGDTSSASQNAPQSSSNAAFSGYATDGTFISADQYAGQVVLLDFWATWCPPCRTAIPSVKRVATKYADQGVKVVGISGDRTINDLKRFEADHNLPYPSIYKGADALFQKYGVRAIPTLVIIGRDGEVAFQGHGDPEKEIKKVLAKG